ncbi:streptophobe family protein [Streptomyces antibioticus]|uniref:streptophobe family protein n=1 Tax=Streptomyces antibioticus TaxID=1890 RepID=UPI0036DBBC77
MSAGTGAYDDKGAVHGTRVPWLDVLLSAIAAVSWALIGMAGTAALGLHLLEADASASLGPMTAAVVALGAGGSVTPSGDVSAFGLGGAEANTAIEITPLGVSLVGALLLSWFFLRSLRTAGVVVAPAELLARAGTVVALFVAMLGGLAWAGHDVVTLDGGALGLDDMPGAGGDGGGGLEIPGLGDIGDIGGLLPDRIGDLIDTKAAVGFTVDTVPTLLGGLFWSAGILLIALLASRRTPLPRGWEPVHRVVRPAVSALVTVVLVAVVAGLAAAAYAAIGDAHPKRIAGAALLGAPNGVWLGLSIGLFVPWDGRATGLLTQVLPTPLDDLLGSGGGHSVTLSRLAELDGRVWLLTVGTAVMMLLAGVLVAVRTPVGGGGAGAGGFGGGGFAGGGAGADGFAGGGAGADGFAGDGGGVGRAAGGGIDAGGSVGGAAGVGGFVGRCALRLGIVTAVALPLLGWLAAVSADASLSVLGFDAFGAGIRLRGNAGMAVLLGAAWGAGAGAAGAVLAHATGAAGRWAAGLALGDLRGGDGVGLGGPAGAGGGAGSGWGAGSGAGNGLGAGGQAGTGAGRGSGVGARTAPGAGAGARPGPGTSAGDGADSGPGARSGAIPGAGAGAGSTVQVGSGTGPWPGAGTGPGAGPEAGHRSEPGPGAGVGAGPGPEVRPGAGAGAGAGRPTDPGTGRRSGAGTGSGAGPGVGAGAWPGADAGAGAGAGHEVGHSPGPRAGAGDGPGAGAGGGPEVGAGPGVDRGAGTGVGAGPGMDPGAGAGVGAGPGVDVGAGSGPYSPNASYRAPNPETNPYLRLPDDVRDAVPEGEPEDARPEVGDDPTVGLPPGSVPPGAEGPKRGR